MKKFLAVIVAMAGVIVLASTAKAATVVLSVTPTGTKSITVNPGAINLGNPVIGTDLREISGSSVTVTNNGTVPETFGLRISAPDLVWGDVDGTTALAALTDKYNLRALFNGNTVPVTANFGVAVAINDIRNVAAGLQTLAGAGAGTPYFGTESGAGVLPTGTNTRGLWFQMNLPGFTSVTTVRNMTVEVSAN